LLEWNSNRPSKAAHVVDAIRQQDEDRSLDDFMLRVFDLFFIEVEEIAPRSCRLGSAGVLVDDFPGLKAEGLTYTRDRSRALRREDLQFLTWDHPLATGALDMLLGSEKGNCSFARWPDPDVSALYCEALYVLEAIAPPALHVDRFLPPAPVRVVVDHRGRDAADVLMKAAVVPHGRTAGAELLIGRAEIRDGLLPRLIEHSRQLAEQETPRRVASARKSMTEQLSGEINRLRQLQKLNRSVREEEIQLLIDQQRALDAHISEARLRLDAIRLIHRGPERRSQNSELRSQK
jgi:ATP-dependent helicase HepA